MSDWQLNYAGSPKTQSTDGHRLASLDVQDISARLSSTKQQEENDGNGVHGY